MQKRTLVRTIAKALKMEHQEKSEDESRQDNLHREKTFLFLKIKF